jgi:glycosyltransferase involved in cell wall biosynthesis
VITTVPRPQVIPRPKARPRPVRVCFLIDELNLAGTESQLLALIRHVGRARVQPYLALLKAAPGFRSTDLCCPVLGLGVRKLRRPFAVLQAWRFAQFLRQERIDVLQMYMPDSTYFGAPAGRWAGVPHIIRTRNNLNHWMTRTDRWLGRLYNRLVHCTLTNSEAARQAVLRDEGPDPDSVHVLENGVDLERFVAVEDLKTCSSSQVRRIGVVANLRKIKGVDVFVEAARLVAMRHPDATFHIAGVGEDRLALEQQIARLNLASRIELCGRVTDIPAFLSSIDVAVLPSRSEGMSNALLEYMAAGRAIVATSVGATPQMLEHGRHGLLVPTENPIALAEAMMATLADPLAAKTRAASARRRAERYYGRQAMIERFERFFAGLVFKPLAA